MSDRTKQRLKTVVTILATALVIAPAAALATGGFNDVQESDFFSDAVDWAKTNQVTVGCNPPENARYCPDDFVTRGQMAVFLQRLDTKNVFLRPGEAPDGSGGDADTLDGKDASDFASAPEAVSQTTWCGRADFFPDFDPGDGTDDEGYSEIGSTIGGEFRTYRTANPSGSLICTMAVPDGATLTRFAATVVDDGAGSVSCDLYGLPVSGSSAGARDNLADVGSTSGATDAVQVLESTSFTDATVDGQVSLEAECFTSDDTGTGVIGALVEFTSTAVPLD